MLALPTRLLRDSHCQWTTLLLQCGGTNRAFPDPMIVRLIEPDTCACGASTWRLHSIEEWHPVSEPTSARWVFLRCHCFSCGALDPTHLLVATIVRWTIPRSHPVLALPIDDTRRAAFEAAMMAGAIDVAAAILATLPAAPDD